MNISPPGLPTKKRQAKINADKTISLALWFWNNLSNAQSKTGINIAALVICSFAQYHVKLPENIKKSPPKKALSGESFKNSLFIAEYNSKQIAANMVNIFGQTATYLHGGSDNESRNLMAPHLLQWEQIKFAKAQGCKVYDFWGCDDEKWPGVSRFKKGFGGREIEFCGTHDYVFDKWWYEIYKIARSVLR